MTFTEANTGPECDPDDCRQIDPSRALELIRSRDALVVDVREPHEHAAGCIPGAQLIPLGQIGHYVDDLRQHRDRPIILSCRLGIRSQEACEFLRGHGFENLYNLAGGVTRWAKANLPLPSPLEDSSF